MNLWLKYILIGLGGYLLGNLSSGILIGRVFGVGDIRKMGSGNAGTTNVLRNLGWIPSVLTLLGDCLKGLIAALAGKWLAGDIGMLVGGLCAVIGHDFPVFFRFRGGKGIATSLGLIIAIHPGMAMILLALVLAVVAVTGYMSLGSVMACFIYPALSLIMLHGHENYGILVAGAVFAGALAFYQHRANLIRLVKKQENRLDFKKITEISKKLGQKNQK